MAKLLDLPNELLTAISRHLCDRKIDHFDSVVGDRYAHALRKHGLGFQVLGTMFRFATFNPELAKHERRLQLRIPDITSQAPYPRDSSGGTVPMPRPDWSEVENEIAMIEDAVAESPQQRRADLITRINLGKAFCNSTWTMEETLALLPNLFHVENAVSMHYRNALESDYIDLQYICGWAEYKEIQALESGSM
ncbi:MAG: hypothetical protein Q9161_003829 [Pseudevernia consocians]